MGRYFVRRRLHHYKTSIYQTPAHSVSVKVAMATDSSEKKEEDDDDGDDDEILKYRLRHSRKWLPLYILINSKSNM